MTSQIREIYQIALKATKSKEVILGQFKGMEMMYKQDHLPEEDIKEIQKIIAEITAEMESGV